MRRLSHSHDSDCADTECTDPTHDHSHTEARQQTTAAKRFGIRTFVYASRRPFDLERFTSLLERLPFARIKSPTSPELEARIGSSGGNKAAAGPFAGVVRSKGFVWLSSDDTVALYWSQAGKQLEISEMGRWWAAVPRESWPQAHVGSIEADWQDGWGDRRQELVFIGANLRESQIRAALDACLATDDEFSAMTPTKPSAAAVAP